MKTMNLAVVFLMFALFGLTAAAQTTQVTNACQEVRQAQQSENFTFTLGQTAHEAAALLFEGKCKATQLLFHDLVTHKFYEANSEAANIWRGIQPDHLFLVTPKALVTNGCDCSCCVTAPTSEATAPKIVRPEDRHRGFGHVGARLSANPSVQANIQSQPTQPKQKTAAASPTPSTRTASASVVTPKTQEGFTHLRKDSPAYIAALNLVRDVNESIEQEQSRANLPRAEVTMMARLSLVNTMGMMKDKTESEIKEALSRGPSYGPLLLIMLTGFGLLTLSAIFSKIYKFLLWDRNGCPYVGRNGVPERNPYASNPA